MTDAEREATGRAGAGETFRFGDCELDLATRELRRRGERVSLQPRVFDLLAFLVLERHRAVDKDAIQDAVWRPMIVSETALTRAIMKARRAVGDDADTQAVIRTVHGHGYRFVATLDDPAPDADAAADAPQAAAEPASGVRRLRWPLLGVAAALIIAVIALMPAGVDSSAVRIAVLPVSNATGDRDFDWARFGLMGLTNDLLVDATELDVVSAADVVRFAENVGWSGDADSPEAAGQIERLRRAYGASHVLVSELTRNVGGLRLNYALIDANGRRDESTMVNAESIELVRGMVHGVNTLLGNRRHILQDGADAIDGDPFINEAYARAVSVALEGRCAEAVPLFDVVLVRNPDVERARLLRGECQRILGNWQDAESSFRDMLAGMSSTDPDAVRAEARRHLGTVLHRTGRLDEADVALAESLDEAQRAGDKFVAGKALISMAILAKDRHDFDDARELLARATLAYRQLEFEYLPGQLYSTLANIGMNDGKLDEAEQHLQQAIESFRAVGDRRSEAMMLNNYGFLRRLQGRFSEAEPLHLQSLAIRREIGDRVGQGRILGMLSVLYDREGRFDDARDAASEAVDIAREANDRLFIATGLAQLGTARRGLGDMDGARAAFTESKNVFVGIEDFSRAAQVDLRLAKLDMDEGELESARSRIDEVLATALAAGLHEPAIEAMHYAGDLAALSDIDAAAGYFERALAHIDATGFATDRTPITIKLAGIYLDRGDVAAAEPLLGHIVEQEDTPDALKLRARYAFATGDGQRSVALMEAARELAPGAWGDADAEALDRYREAP